MLPANKKNNRSHPLGIPCILALVLCFMSNAWAASPRRPKKPLEPVEIKTVNTPKVSQTVPSYQDGSPFSVGQSIFWKTRADPDIRTEYGKGQGNVHWGTIELHPIGSFQQKYDTNIFLEPRGNETMDWISNYKVGLAAKSPLVPSRGDDYMAEVEYHADFYDFMRYDRLNRMDSTAHAAVRGNFPNGIGAKVTEDFFYTQDPPNNELTGLSKRWWNKLDGKINYTREKITVEAGYSVIMNRYLRYHNLNYNDHMMTGTVFYNVSEKTRLLNEFNIGRIQYRKSPTNSNSYYWQDRIGVEGKIAPKLTGTFKFGFRYQNYERKTAQDYAFLTTFGNIRYDLSERTTLNLYGESRPEESSYANNSHYGSHIIGFKGEHLFTQRIAADGGIFWAYDRYPELTTEGDKSAKRKDWLWGADVSLKYELRKWWLLDAGYRFKQRNSNFHNFFYNDHQVTARTTFLL